MSDVTANYEAPLGFVVFFGEFSHIFNNYSFLKGCIFIKLSHNVCLINTYFLVYTKCRSRLLKGSSIGKFLYLYNYSIPHTYLKIYVSIKFPQIELAFHLAIRYFLV